MRFLTRSADSRLSGNISSRSRAKRFDLFSKLVSPGEIRSIVDVGGTADFWLNLNSAERIDIPVTLVNIDDYNLTTDKFVSVKGDANNLKFFKDKSFGIIFSNSMIEHLGIFAKQKKFADEARRIADYYFIQTPAYSFFFEQHFLTPFFHFLPVSVRARLMTRFNLGWFKKAGDYSSALKLIKSIRIMKLGELREIFPEGRIIKERFFGMTKSYIVTNLPEN